MERVLGITQCNVRIVVDGSTSSAHADVKSSLARFVFKVCERADHREDNDIDESMDLGNGVHLENGGGGADSVSVARVHCAWRKYRELSVILTRKEVSLKMKGKVYVTCERSMVHV